MEGIDFQVYVYKADGSPASYFIVVNVVGKANDISYMYNNRGEYYLRIKKLW